MLNKFRQDLPARNPARYFLRPHPLIMPYIAYYTIYFPKAEAVSRLNLLPDGSGCLVFSFDEKQAQASFMGASTVLTTVQDDENNSFFFVEFKPGGAARLFDFPHKELVDQRAILSDIQAGLGQDILNTIESSLNIEELAEKIDQIFLQILFGKTKTHPSEVLLSNINQMNGLTTVRQLSESLHYSERHLRRVFGDGIGLSLKTYLKIMRINKTVESMKGWNGDLAGLAAAQGYYDQAHFIHDFKSVCGVTPKEYIQNQSIFYNDPYKF